MALVFYIKVVPGARKKGWVIDTSGILKIFITAQPEKGLANQELIRQLSKALRITQSNIEINSGTGTRIKKITIKGDLSFEKVMEKLIKKP